MRKYKLFQNKIGINSFEVCDKIQEDIVNENLECIICLDEITNKNECIQLECNHIFHKSCIEQWTQRQCNCPICRKNIYVNYNAEKIEPQCFSFKNDVMHIRALENELIIENKTKKKKTNYFYKQIFKIEHNHKIIWIHCSTETYKLKLNEKNVNSLFALLKERLTAPTQIRRLSDIIETP